MVDYYKGFLVTLEKDMIDDKAQSVIEALKMIKYVHNVRPYVSTLEDEMVAHRTKLNTIKQINEMFLKELTKRSQNENTK